MWCQSTRRRFTGFASQPQLVSFCVLFFHTGRPGCFNIMVENLCCSESLVEPSSIAKSYGKRRSLEKQRCRWIFLAFQVEDIHTPLEEAVICIMRNKVRLTPPLVTRPIHRSYPTLLYRQRTRAPNYKNRCDESTNSARSTCTCTHNMGDLLREHPDSCAFLPAKMMHFQSSAGWRGHVRLRLPASNMLQRIGGALFCKSEGPQASIETSLGCVSRIIVRTEGPRVATRSRHKRTKRRASGTLARVRETLTSFVRHQHQLITRITAHSWPPPPGSLVRASIPCHTWTCRSWTEKAARDNGHVPREQCHRNGKVGTTVRSRAHTTVGSS